MRRDGDGEIMTGEVWEGRGAAGACGDDMVGAAAEATGGGT